jgi:hypothetical protein
MVRKTRKAPWKCRFACRLQPLTPYNLQAILSTPLSAQLFVGKKLFAAVENMHLQWMECWSTAGALHTA